MSHITDPNVSYYLPAGPAWQSWVSAGSATITDARAGSLWVVRVAAGAGGAALEVKWSLSPGLGQGARQRGFCLKNLDVWYFVAFGVTTLDLAASLVTLPEDGAAFGAAAAQALAYDQDDAARVQAGNRKVVCTLAQPCWIGPGQALQFKMALTMAANGDIHLGGARLRGRLRT
jgi:hypothetical protein